MFDKLADFDPACWQESGLVLAPPPRRVAKQKLPLRRAPWTISFGMGVTMLALGSVSPVTLEARRCADSGVAVSSKPQQMSAPSAHFRGDPDYVAPEFWGNVRQRLESLPPMTDSADSPDPEPFV